MINENDVVRATRDLSEEIKINTIGAVLAVFDNSKAFMVEFIDDNKQTIGNGMTTVELGDIELVWSSNQK